MSCFPGCQKGFSAYAAPWIPLHHGRAESVAFARRAALRFGFGCTYWSDSSVKAYAKGGPTLRRFLSPRLSHSVRFF